MKQYASIRSDGTVAQITTTDAVMPTTRDGLSIVEYTGELPDNPVWNGTEFVSGTAPDSLTTSNTAKILRLLAACDWTQLPDTDPIAAATYLTYRNALRALPNDINWPDVAFPTPPNIGRLD
jgi:hypothetical protein